MSEGAVICDFSRQQEIFNPELLRPHQVSVIGLGSVGSAIALILSQIGAEKIFCYDNGIVYEESVPSQFFRHCDVGKKKTEAMDAIIRKLAGFGIKMFDHNVASREQFGKIVFQCTDTIASRREIWAKSGIKYNPFIKIFIDVRLGPESFRIYVLDPCNRDHITYYEKSLAQEEKPRPQTSMPTSVLAGAVAVEQMQRLLKCQFNWGNMNNEFTLDLLNLCVQKSKIKANDALNNGFPPDRPVYDPSTILNTKLDIIGCGATGSHAGFFLAQVGARNINFWDFDTVMPHNIPNQLFRMEDIGKPKVEAMKNIIEDVVGFPSFAHNEKVCSQSGLGPYVFLLVDTMSGRKEIWKNCIKGNRAIKAMVETRMSSQYCKIYLIDPNNPKHCQYWEDTLCDDSQAELSSCGTSMSIETVAATTAALAVRIFDHFCDNQGDWNQIPNELMFSPGSLQLFSDKIKA